jgi:hypothetical protein
MVSFNGNCKTLLRPQHVEPRGLLFIHWQGAMALECLTSVGFSDKHRTEPESREAARDSNFLMRRLK